MDGRRKRGRRGAKTAKHAGVVLYPRALPSGATAWRARFTDPDTGKKKHETLPPQLTTDDERAAWALTKKNELDERVRELAKGGVTKKNVSLADAVERYFASVASELREKTLKCYRQSADALLAWASSRGIVLADDLRGDGLAELRAWIANKKLRRPAAGDPKRSRKETKSVRSPAAINRELREVKVVLEALRRLGLVPLLSRDAIADNLRLAKAPRPVPKPLRPEELVRLIGAASRHDRDTFGLTREEKERGETKGKTPRYSPVLPYLVTVLLTGMRADEAREVTWDVVDLTAEPGGKIELLPERVKTKHGRLVDLSVSPALRAMLTKMHLRAGGKGFVFGTDEKPFDYEALKAARKRLVADFGAPAFSWQKLRVTCGTFLANAPGIFGAASAYREAKQLGHSVTVAEKHYLGVVHVAPEARTLEAAMGIEGALAKALGLHVEAKAEKIAKVSA